MKLNGFVGKGSGKLGASVFAISGGEQIVRQYNPQVANPNTDAQVAQRAKLKLMSQLAAALAPGIAFKKKGLKSARNQFVSANIGLATYSNGKAQIGLPHLQISEGTQQIPDVQATRGENNSLSVLLEGEAMANVNGVVYVVATFDDTEQITNVEVKVVEEAGAGRTFPTTFTSDGDAAVVYAYGLIDANMSHRASYGDYQVNETGAISELTTNVNIIKSAVAYTKNTATQV